MPEAQIILSQAVTYIASAPKSNAACEAIGAAMTAVQECRTSVPPHLQDAHYKDASSLGRGTGYQYAHNFPNHYVNQQYLPDELEGRVFYQPTEMGYEKKIKDWLEELKK